MQGGRRKTTMAKGQRAGQGGHAPGAVQGSRPAAGAVQGGRRRWMGSMIYLKPEPWAACCG